MSNVKFKSDILGRLSFHANKNEDDLVRVDHARQTLLVTYPRKSVLRNWASFSADSAVQSSDFYILENLWRTFRNNTNRRKAELLKTNDCTPSATIFNTDAKQNFAIHSDRSLLDQITFETMIGM